MCRYMQLPIAFRDNQQISLVDSTEMTLFKKRDDNEVFGG